MSGLQDHSLKCRLISGGEEASWGVNYAHKVTLPTEQGLGEGSRVASLSPRSCGKSLVLEEMTSLNKYSRKE